MTGWLTAPHLMVFRSLLWILRYGLGLIIANGGYIGLVWLEESIARLYTSAEFLYNGPWSTYLFFGNVVLAYLLLSPVNAFIFNFPTHPGPWRAVILASQWLPVTLFMWLITILTGLNDDVFGQFGTPVMVGALFFNTWIASGNPIRAAIWGREH